MSSVDPDKTEPTVIRGAKISFKPVRDYPADAQTLSYYAMRARIGAEMYQRWIDGNFNIRVISVCGYNPQKLLPAPTFEREFLQSVAEWAAEQIKTPYTEFAQSVFNTQTRDGEVQFTPTGRYVDPRRKPEPIYALLGGVPVELHTDADFLAMERRVLNHIYSAFIDTENLDRLTPRGKIEIYDYGDGTTINLEGEGELPGRPDIVDDLFSGEFARRMAKTRAMTQKLEQRPAPRKSYLDHDPTKQHKRRKKK